MECHYIIFGAYQHSNILMLHSIQIETYHNVVVNVVVNVIVNVVVNVVVAWYRCTTYNRTCTVVKLNCNFLHHHHLRH